MAAAIKRLAACAVLACGALAAEDFLGSRGNLFEELESTLGAEATKASIAAMEEALRQMYTAVPKNRQGCLDDSAVRYVLHRYFVQLHGWVIVGLEPGNRTVGTAQAPLGIDVLKGQVTTRAGSLLENRLGAHGFCLRELAAVAVTLERLIHNEAGNRLERAFEGLSLPTEASLHHLALDEVLDAYMSLYLIGNALGEKRYNMRKLIGEMPKIYPGWQDTRTFAQDTMRNVAFAQRHRTNPFKPVEHDFGGALRVAERIGEGFGQFQNAECQDLKDALVSREVLGSGRVLLSDFYKIGLEGKYFLKESIDYLRTLGALDERSSGEPRVIVPNFIYSKTNCMASTSLYTVCCIDECEPLLAHLERAIAAPTASPAEIATIVAALPSSTVDAPRNLSAALLRRLEDIAAGNRGVVSLHGRLFAQWMHHAYPRECPYPHVSGTAVNLMPKDFERASGASVSMSKEGIHEYLATSAGNPAEEVDVESEAELGPWNPEEELFVKAREPLALWVVRSVQRASRPVMLVAAIASLAVGLSRAQGSSQADTRKKLSHPHYV